ncbi:MAG: 2-dehydro-3-deoxygalactonokinase [Verrucomicrobiae bacterium]|nr:2-dehydro-3-deoxygalactonokinase [Verrucomicrobiae bacterium]
MKANADLLSPASTLIAVDWGSTNFRASLVVDGDVVDHLESPDGIRHRNGRDYDDLLHALVGHWRAARGEADVVMSGMVGSREGWVEVPYAAAPAGVADLAAGIVRVPSRHFGSVAIIPGVRWDDPQNGTTDVMRGEETQVAGLLDGLPEEEAVTLCLPGTHSKWIVCRHGKIERFRTFLTGEAFERLTRDSLISGDGRAAIDPNSPAFARGLTLSADTDGGLLHHLFLGRTEMLTGRVAPDALSSLISGLLIGHEIREGASFADGTLYLNGTSPVAQATATAMRLLGFELRQDSRNSHLAGLRAIAEKWNGRVDPDG